eukprot:scaffold345560_cov29-Prasinocladus_malaysianus.AAC.2
MVARVSERRVDTLTQRSNSAGKCSQESMPAKNIHSNSGSRTLTASIMSTGKLVQIHTRGKISPDSACQSAQQNESQAMEASMERSVSMQDWQCTMMQERRQSHLLSDTSPAALGLQQPWRPLRPNGAHLSAITDSDSLNGAAVVGGEADAGLTQNGG